MSSEKGKNVHRFGSVFSIVHSVYLLMTFLTIHAILSNQTKKMYD